MFVTGSFEYNMHLELAISELEKKGIPREGIAAVLMDSRVEERKIIDTIHRADGISSFDTAALLGTFCMLIGAIYGFILYWGPIIWGLIGLFGGAVIGFVGDIFLTRFIAKFRGKKGATGSVGGKAVQVILIVECDDELKEKVKEVLWDNLALGVGTLPG